MGGLAGGCTGAWRGVELAGLTLREPPPGDLHLRHYRPGDVDAVHAGLADPQTARFLDVPVPYTRADAVEYCTRVAPGRAEQGTALELAMTDAGGGPVLGGASLRLPAGARGTAEIGYLVYPPFRGRALAERATRLLAAWAFAHDVDRVELRAAVDNLASARTALAAGFRFEVVARLGIGTGRGQVDAALFARCAGDDGTPIAPWLPPFGGIGDDLLLLRQLGPGDEAVIEEDLTDAESLRWVVGEPCPDPPGFARDRARAAPLRRLVGPNTRVALVDRASGETAGVLEIRQAGPPDVVEVGYAVRAAFRGRGTATRALRLFCAWAFDTAGLARVELGADTANLASQRVAERAGFVREGVSPGRLRHAHGGYRDGVRYGLTPGPGRPAGAPAG